MLKKVRVVDDKPQITQGMEDRTKRITYLRMAQKIGQIILDNNAVVITEEHGEEGILFTMVTTIVMPEHVERVSTAIAHYEGYLSAQAED